MMDFNLPAKKRAFELTRTGTEGVGFLDRICLTYYIYFLTRGIALGRARMFMGGLGTTGTLTGVEIVRLLL